MCLSFPAFFATVLMEIEDRRKFLDEMEALGQGGKYRTIISTEISQVSRKNNKKISTV